jgi:RNA polymerase sigma-70 factor (ECF subfamily)
MSACEPQLRIRSAGENSNPSTHVANPLTHFVKMITILVESIKPFMEGKPTNEDLGFVPADITGVLRRWNAGDPVARQELIEFMYPELKRIAQARMRSERIDHTLQATALVSEFFLLMARREDLVWQNRGHFLATAAQAMKRLLIDHARARHAAKRSSGEPELCLDFPEHRREGPPVDILDFNRHLERLWVEEPRMAQVVELHCFGGLTHAEIAEVIGVDVRTVRRDWQVARAWLVGHLKKG